MVKKSNLPLKEALTADITGASVSRLGNTRDRGGPSTGPSTCDVRSGCNVRTCPSTWSVLSKGSAVVPIINIKLFLWKEIYQEWNSKLIQFNVIYQSHLQSQEESIYRHLLPSQQSKNQWAQHSPIPENR